jgi:hypothetical protein
MGTQAKDDLPVLRENPSAVTPVVVRDTEGLRLRTYPWANKRYGTVEVIPWGKEGAIRTKTARRDSVTTCRVCVGRGVVRK